jgi:hypothetical protein
MTYVCQVRALVDSNMVTKMGTTEHRVKDKSIPECKRTQIGQHEILMVQSQCDRRFKMIVSLHKHEESDFFFTQK